MNKDTGFPRADAEHDFLRARRRQVLSRLANWLRREPDDVNIMLPFKEVVEALGYQGERRLGLRVIKLDSIVGSVDRGRDFDRRFRPTSGRVRERWERLALAARRGEDIPPIEVYRIGELHFIIDGHHRVSVAHSLGLSTIEAHVTEVKTKLDPSGIRYRGDLIVKDYRRLFLERVPLTGHARASIVVSEPWHYAKLGDSTRRTSRHGWTALPRRRQCRCRSCATPPPGNPPTSASGSAGGRTEKDLQIAGTSPYGLPNRLRMGSHRFDGSVLSPAGHGQVRSGGWRDHGAFRNRELGAHAWSASPRRGTQPPPVGRDRANRRP
jgi:hypothetical protein